MGRDTVLEDKGMKTCAVQARSDRRALVRRPSRVSTARADEHRTTQRARCGEVKVDPGMKRIAWI